MSVLLLRPLHLLSLNTQNFGSNGNHSNQWRAHIPSALCTCKFELRTVYPSERACIARAWLRPGCFPAVFLSFAGLSLPGFLFQRMCVRLNPEPQRTTEC